MSSYDYKDKLLVGDLRFAEGSTFQPPPIENQLTITSGSQLSSLTLQAVGGSSATVQHVWQPWRASGPVLVEQLVDRAFSGDLIRSWKPFGNGGNSPRIVTSRENIDGLCLGSTTALPSSRLDVYGTVTHTGLREREFLSGNLGPVLRRLDFDVACTSAEEQVIPLNARLQQIGVTNLRQFHDLAYHLVRTPDGPGDVNAYQYDASHQSRYKITVDGSEITLRVQKHGTAVDLRVHVRSLWRVDTS